MQKCLLRTRTPEICPIVNPISQAHCQNIQVIQATNCRLCVQVVNSWREGTMSFNFCISCSQWGVAGLWNQKDLDWNADSFTSVIVTDLKQITYLSLGFCFLTCEMGMVQ